jgi:hypothetical protein
VFIEHFLCDKRSCGSPGDYANNEVSLGVLLSGKEEIQVQLKVTRAAAEFIETGYFDEDDSVKHI